mgnify:CR=1 FL=1
MSLERVRFLVVDDNVHMVNIVKTILRGFGAKVFYDASDAVDALDRVRHDPIDMIICDYHMPVMDGIDFVKLVRTSADCPNPYVPIIMLTAHTERSRVATARDAGITEFCAKPVTALELYRKIANVINRPRMFVSTPTYTGPCRRRADRPFQGPDRRGQGAPAQKVQVAVANSEEAEMAQWEAMGGNGGGWD